MVDEQDDKPPRNILSLGGEDYEPPPSDLESSSDEPEETTRIVALHLHKWTDARESLARLETELRSSKEDIRRAVEYARGLEEECDRLADLQHETQHRIGEVQSELAEERGRRLELEEQYQHLVERLETLSGIRGRYHLERGRREQAQEQNQALTSRLHELERDLESMTEALEEARRQGFRVDLGPLSIELKR